MKVQGVPKVVATFFYWSMLYLFIGTHCSSGDDNNRNKRKEKQIKEDICRVMTINVEGERKRFAHISKL